MNSEILINKSMLSQEDKELLLNLVNSKRYPNDVHKLSIFSKLGFYDKINNYNTYNVNSEVFYSSLMNIWMDNEFKLLPISNWWFETDLERFIIHINHYINFINKIDKKSNFDIINENVFAITKWFTTYGHFLDEIFCLKDFELINNNDNIIPFISFPLEAENNIYKTSNYKTICDLLWNKYFNAYKQQNIIKIKSVILIRHLYNDVTFHSFPLTVCDFIEKKIISNDIIINDKILFITRGYATHLKRNLDNQMEIEEYLKNNNVDIFNPENNDFDKLVNIIKCYKKIIITWGSALVNLIFCNNESEIIILKSESYKNEQINLFNKIIKSRKLKISIMDSVNNIIEPSSILGFFN
jgi:hypothetical protein